MKNNILVRDDVRRLVVGLDEVVVGLRNLEAVRALEDHPEVQCDIRSFTSIVKRAADYLANLREQWHR
jgi:hypothetical protein